MQPLSDERSQLPPLSPDLKQEAASLDQKLQSIFSGKERQTQEALAKAKKVSDLNISTLQSSILKDIVVIDRPDFVRAVFDPSQGSVLGAYTLKSLWNQAAQISNSFMGKEIFSLLFFHHQANLQLIFFLD